MSIFDFDNYKKFVLTWVRQQSKSGYGQFKKMAEHLAVSSVLLSQVFKGDRQLSTEQALELAEYLNLLEIEKKYFVLLVRKERAGSKKLERHIQTEIQELLSQAQKLKTRIEQKAELNSEDQALFYSSWHFSALRLATDIPELRNVAQLSERFALDPQVVKSALEFLVEKGLCVLEQGELRLGPSIVFLSADSPYINSRHLGWRIKAGAQMGLKNKEDLYFTCPIVCSAKSKNLIRNKLLNLITEVLKEVKDSPSEDLACLNIDWFGF